MSLVDSKGLSYLSHVHYASMRGFSSDQFQNTPQGIGKVM